MQVPESIDAYLAALDAPRRGALAALRAQIQALVPEAEECFSYGLPTLRVEGRMLVSFAAAKHHCALYPLSARVVTAFAEELAGFSTSPGTIRFQPDHPLPAGLLAAIVAQRLAENRARPRAKGCGTRVKPAPGV